MIYLLEDKKTRRNDYGWTDEKISLLKDVITVVENATDLIELMPGIITSGNVVLYHESFTKNESYEKEKEVKSFIDSLEKVHNIHIAYFSGSKSQRKNEGLRCDLNYDPLYTNLDVFIKNYKQGTTNFDYLLFGENPEIEKKLLQTIQKTNNENIDVPAIASPHRILALRTQENGIQIPILKCDKEICDYDCSDIGMIKLIESFSNSRYDAIYIPLCMGETLSDFLGLRLGLLFRLSNTINKYAHIFIYGVVGLSLLMKDECSEILKMRGVNYILADGNSIKKSIQHIHRLNKEEYHWGLKRIHLNVPTNIGDNHAVANIWGIYRWSMALGDSDETIEKNNEEIYNSLYFKYLSALYPPSETSHINRENLLIEKDNKMPELNILYVDDEADEGWYELICYLIHDLNDIHEFAYVGRELKSMKENEIISHIMSRIKEEDINLVILDLRLHQNDFYYTNIKDIVGYRLLQEIKHYNRGIQVLFFSATNKIWNLQALQEEEADGFVVKESPENSIDEYFTEESIFQFVDLLSKCSKNTYRKELWPRLQKLKSRIKYHLRRSNVEESYANNILTLLSMVEDTLFSNFQNNSIDYAFINLFTIVELTANEWIEVKNEGYNIIARFKDTTEPLHYFDLEKKSTRLGEEIRDYPNWGQKIANTLDYVQSYDTKIQDLVKKRNDFTHPKGKLTYFSKEDINDILKVVEKIIFKIKDD